MNHYKKCILKYIKINFLIWSEYKFDLLAINISNLILLCVSIINIEIIFTQVNSILGWNKYEILWMIGYYNLVEFLWDSFFINTVDLGYWVRTGNLDIFLIRPLNIFFQLIFSSRYNTEFSIEQLAIGVGLLLYTNNEIGIVWSFGFILLFILLLLCSLIIYTNIIFSLSCISLWTIQSGVILEIVNNLEELIHYPINIYGNIFKNFFTFVIPLGFVSYYPAQFFLKSESIYIIIIPIIAFLTTIISRLIWKNGIKNYQGTGS